MARSECGHCVLTHANQSKFKLTRTGIRRWALKLSGVRVSNTCSLSLSSFRIEYKSPEYTDRSSVLAQTPLRRTFAD